MFLQRIRGIDTACEIVVLCRLPMPTTMSENFDKSFGDVDRIQEMRQDELIHWSNPRLRMITSALRVSGKLLEKSKEIKTPWLVCFPGCCM